MISLDKRFAADGREIEKLKPLSISVRFDQLISLVGVYGEIVHTRLTISP
jgi:hypothetical protein